MDDQTYAGLVAINDALAYAARQHYPFSHDRVGDEHKCERCKRNKKARAAFDRLFDNLNQESKMPTKSPASTRRSKAAASHESTLFIVNVLGKTLRSYVFRTREAARIFRAGQHAKGKQTSAPRKAVWGPEA